MPRWVPNAISSFRIALVPIWVIWAYLASREPKETAAESQPMLLLILAVLGASDLLDGFVARRYGLTTNLGAALDAVADKLAQVATVSFLTLVPSPTMTHLPWWLMGVLLLRDALLAVGWVWIKHRHGEVKVRHDWHGRAASVLLFAVVFIATGGWGREVIDVLSAAIALFIVPSTALYLREGVRQLSAEP